MSVLSVQITLMSPAAFWLSGLRPDSRSKIKYRHEGSAPCHACSIASRTDCHLSAPVTKGKSRLVDTGAPGARLGDITETHASPPTKRLRVASSGFSQSANHVQPLDDLAGSCSHLPILTLMLQACDLLHTLFPEFGFLHRPSFVDQLLGGSVETARLHAILSVTARFMPTLVPWVGGPEAAGEFYAAKAETAVSYSSTANIYLSYHTGARSPPDQSTLLYLLVSLRKSGGLRILRCCSHQPRVSSVFLGQHKHVVLNSRQHL
jgi:hypothetical protein